MKHQICANAKDFAEGIRDAAIYAGKDNESGLNRVILAVLPKERKLSIIGCDGMGYFERKIALEVCKNQPKPSLPEKDMRLVISLPDVSMLCKFIPARQPGSIRLEVDDDLTVDNRYSAKLILANGARSTFFCDVQPVLPDLKSIKTNALKGKKKPLQLSNIHVPVRELLRAGKVFSGKNPFAQIFTSKGTAKGVMALLECKNDLADISVIFMLNDSESA